MAIDNGFDVAAFKHHLDVIYHNVPTDIPPPGLNLFAPGRSLVKPGAHASDAHDTPHKTADASARDKLTSEALHVSPAEMRKLWPQVAEVKGWEEAINGHASQGYLTISDAFQGTTRS